MSLLQPSSHVLASPDAKPPVFAEWFSGEGTVLVQKVPIRLPPFITPWFKDSSNNCRTRRWPWWNLSNNGNTFSSRDMLNSFLNWLKSWRTCEQGLRLFTVPERIGKETASLDARPVLSHPSLPSLSKHYPLDKMPVDHRFPAITVPSLITRTIFSLNEEKHCVKVASFVFLLRKREIGEKVGKHGAFACLILNCEFFIS